MLNLTDGRNYIVIKEKKELSSAKLVDLCDYIIFEHKASITIWNRNMFKWERKDYHFFNDDTVEDFETTGFVAYKEFFKYCGEEEVEKMKEVFPLLDLWDSQEQLHYYNMEYCKEKIYKDIYVYDANSAFTYGALQLPKEFDKLKEYLLLLYENKKTATSKYLRKRYKNLQNYLIGYFARVKKLVAVRSKIIEESNENIYKRMYEIRKAGGIVYISNTDSIVTDKIGSSIMEKYKGENVGQFKLERVSKKLYYNSSNSYQIGDKLVWSGLNYFAAKHTDVFKEEYGKQYGKLLVEKDFILDENDRYRRLCRVEYGKVVVVVENKIGEELKRFVYKLGENKNGIIL